MNCFFFHPVCFRTWDYTTPDTEGIGGSETSQIEVAWRLAKRGHRVVSYAPVPWEGPRMWRGVEWRPLQEADFSQPGEWLLYRCPAAIDNFPDPHPDQRIFLVSQDESYWGQWNDDRLRKLDWFLALCRAHAVNHLRVCPQLKDKIRVWSNGIRVDLIREIEKEAIERNPRKIVYASSPDRGLETLLRFFPRIREWVHDATLTIAYGFFNIDVLVKMDPKYNGYKILKDRIMKLADQPGVSWVGNLPQPDLIRQWFSAGLWVHPSLFTETSCITCMDAQACGAIPITVPIWAVGENVHHGVFIQGDCVNDPLIQARFVGETYKLMTNPDLQESIRPEMMKEARARFNWERMVDYLEASFYGFDHHPMITHQFAFQLKHANGKILNVGCASDPAGFKKKGAVNMDVNTEDPIFHDPTKADILADVRDLPGPLNGEKFDTVVLGDILEHFDPKEVPDILRKCVRCLTAGGKLVITVPEDYRPPDVQHRGSDGSHMYTNGVSAVHLYPVTEEIIRGWCKEAELKIEVLQEMDIDSFGAHGIVAVPEHPTLDVGVGAEIVAAHQYADSVPAD